VGVPRDDREADCGDLCRLHIRGQIPLNDQEADWHLRAYQFPPMVEVGRRRTIVVLQPASSLSTGADR
jgi:hypothetical protein